MRITSVARGVRVCVCVLLTPVCNIASRPYLCVLSVLRRDNWNIRRLLPPPSTFFSRKDSQVVADDNSSFKVRRRHSGSHSFSAVSALAQPSTLRRRCFLSYLAARVDVRRKCTICSAEDNVQGEPICDNCVQVLANNALVLLLRRQRRAERSAVAL